jgi:uncharacterized protein YdhG (YjbR/CyaY superfamily)
MADHAPGRDKESVVVAWFADYVNPHRELMLTIRSFILDLDPRIEECIKWKTPTFTYRGNIASFNPRAKRHVSLMFHAGATIPGEHPHLTHSGPVAAYITFTDAADFTAKKADLAEVLRAWIRMKDQAASTP